MMVTLADIEKNVGTIVVFYDFSDAALNAAKYAAALAGQLNSSRLLLYYSEHVPTTMELHPQTIRLAEHENLKRLKQFKALKNELQISINKKILIETYIDQRPLAEIVNGLDESIGLVVMGMAGKSLLERTFIGSNTLHVAQITTIPLLIVPEHTTFETIGKIVFACDVKKISEITPVYAIKRMVSSLGAKLSILHVDKNGERFNPDKIAQMTFLYPLWDNEQPEYHCTDDEDIARGVMEFADEHQMQMVIAVPKTYGFFEKLFHESLTTKLAYHIHVPLLLLREEKQ
jgi:nucleotide-binding universal stress UspA family protein